MALVALAVPLTRKASPQNAATTGASVHICHTLATGRYAGQSGWADMLHMVTGINAHGVDVSMEQYPYPYVREGPGQSSDFASRAAAFLAPD